MFSNCSSLKQIKLYESCNVSNGEDFSSIFEECSSLEDIKSLKNWNVSNATNFSDMFNGCFKLSDINPLKNWNVSNKNFFSTMFTPKNLNIISHNITHFAFPDNQGLRYIILFQSSIHKVEMSIPMNAKIGKILLEYISLVGLDPEIIGKQIHFLFNGSEINKQDFDKTAEELGLRNMSIIIVYEN
jgi:hypothetical protein